MIDKWKKLRAWVQFQYNAYSSDICSIDESIRGSSFFGQMLYKMSELEKLETFEKTGKCER